MRIHSGTKQMTLYGWVIDNSPNSFKHWFIQKQNKWLSLKRLTESFSQLISAKLWIPSETKQVTLYEWVTEWFTHQISSKMQIHSGTKQMTLYGWVVDNSPNSFKHRFTWEQNKRLSLKRLTESFSQLISADSLWMKQVTLYDWVTESFFHLFVQKHWFSRAWSK